jgi:hypothetical protein
MIALHHAIEARTVDWQVRHAAEARRAYEDGLRDLAVRREAARHLPEHDARTIAERAADLDADALDQFAADLRVVEHRIAQALRDGAPSLPHRRLFPDEATDD